MKKYFWPILLPALLIVGVIGALQAPPVDLSPPEYTKINAPKERPEPLILPGGSFPRLWPTATHAEWEEEVKAWCKKRRRRYAAISEARSRPKQTKPDSGKPTGMISTRNLEMQLLASEAADKTNFKTHCE